MEVKYYEEQLEKMRKIRDDDHHAVRVAVCGRFKSGKSSLLNLLLHTELPVMAVTATGTVTKIIYGKARKVCMQDGSIRTVTKEEIHTFCNLAV